jgi:hypothetical protein
MDSFKNMKWTKESSTLEKRKTRKIGRRKDLHERSSKTLFFPQTLACYYLAFLEEISHTMITGTIL